MKTFIVSGTACVPVEVAMKVVAETADEAKQIAVYRFENNPEIRRNAIVSNSHDDMSAFGMIAGDAVESNS